MGSVKHLSLELLERYVMQDISSRDQQRVERHVMQLPGVPGPVTRRSRMGVGSAYRGQNQGEV